MSADNKRKAEDLENPAKRKSPVRPARPKRTLGDTFGMVHDATLCIPQGSSAKIMQMVASTDAEIRNEDSSNSVAGDDECPIDADEALIKVYMERATEKQASVIDTVKHVFGEQGNKYASYMLKNDASLPGRINIVKALKGFEDAAKKMDAISTKVAQAFEDAICENS